MAVCKGEVTVSDILDRVSAVIAERKASPSAESYVAKLISKGEDRILRKIGEETTELILAAKSEGDERVVSEAADLVFHMLVLFGLRDISIDALYAELERRFGTSGLAEKASRKQEG